jgi:hypothetical protein
MGTSRECRNGGNMMAAGGDHRTEAGDHSRRWPTSGTISISWLATDAGSGVQHYDLAYRVDDGSWVVW